MLTMVLMSLTASPLQAEDEKGCLAYFNRQNGSFTYEPFLKIADKTSFSEDGKPEVWGFRLWNLEKEKDGKTHAVNVLEEIWIPNGKLKKVGPRKTRCPPYWGG
jgi:hypothetical protein